MTDTDHEAYIRRALALAREAADAGNPPFGSLLVFDGEIVAEEYNTTLADGDVTAHPELKLARWAARELTLGECRETTMYTSTMPCMMCSGAIDYAGLGAVVYSVDGETASELAPGDRDGPKSDHLREKAGVRVVGPVLEAEGRAVHTECWDRVER